MFAMIMTKRQKIDKIYKVIANKEPTIGCKFLDGSSVLIVIQGGLEIRRKQGLELGWMRHYAFLDKYKIIGHPVMIGDVLDYLCENKKECDPVYAKNPIRGGMIDNICNNYVYLCNRWENKRDPIENESDYLIDFIYSLLP